MSCRKKRKNDQRRCSRLPMQNSILVTIRGGLENTVAGIRDMNTGGMGCYVKHATGIKGTPVILDIVSKPTRTIIRSLPAQIVFTDQTDSDTGKAQAGWQRCGIRFTDLSELQKRLLQLIVNKYALPKQRDTPKRETS